MKPALLCIALVACAASTRQTAISAAFSTTLAAGSALEAFDGLHEQSIVAAGLNKAGVDAALAAWQAERTKARAALLVATQLEVAAALANDDASLATMTSAVAALIAELKADGLSVP